MMRSVGSNIANMAAKRASFLKNITRPIAATSGVDVPKPELKVFKFGGSSVGSAQALRDVAQILVNEKDNGNSVVSVLSAMFGITNFLVGATQKAAAHDMSGVRANRETVVGLHKATAEELLSSPSSRAMVMEYVENILKTYFDNVTEEIAEKKGADAYDVDRVSSLGERLSSRIMAAYLDSLEGTSSEFLESDRLIVTDNVSGGATPQLAPTKENVEKLLVPALERGALPIVTGFFGATPEGRLTTLGRGGSDLSATVLGHALDADEVSLFKVEYNTDKDGWLKEWEEGWVGVVHDADTSKTIPAIAYEEAAELAHFGKKVLHPETVSPAIQKSIPICVKNTYDPEHTGTRICMMSDLPNDAVAVAAITKMDVPEYEAKHKRAIDTGALPKDEASIVAMIGVNLMTWNSLNKEVQSTLEAGNIPHYIPNAVSGSGNNFSVVVPSALKKDAVKALYNSFVNEEALKKEGVEVVFKKSEEKKVQYQ